MNGFSTSADQGQSQVTCVSMHRRMSQHKRASGVYEQHTACKGLHLFAVAPSSYCPQWCLYTASNQYFRCFCHGSSLPLKDTCAAALQPACCSALRARKPQCRAPPPSPAILPTQQALCCPLHISTPLLVLGWQGLMRIVMAPFAYALPDGLITHSAVTHRRYQCWGRT
jgi:hypothetical protein